jgi:hypothetical protein
LAIDSAFDASRSGLEGGRHDAGIRSCRSRAVAPMTGTTRPQESAMVRSLRPVLALAFTALVLAAPRASALSFDVDFQVVNDWGSGFQAQIELHNTGDEPIVGWTLGFDLARPITSLWNGVYLGSSGGVHAVQDAGWNASIAPGSSVVIGFNGGAGGPLVPPTTYTVNGQPSGGTPPVLPPVYDLVFRVVNDWGSGFQAEIEITNLGADPIGGWTLEFELARTITSLWNGTLVGSAGDVHTVGDAGYNAQILPGQSVIIGFNGQTGGLTTPPSGYLLNGFAPVPELDTATLLAAGFAGLAWSGRSRRSRAGL